MSTAVTYGTTATESEITSIEVPTITNTYVMIGTVTITKHSENLNGLKLAGCHYILYKLNDNGNSYMTGTDNQGYATWSDKKASAVEFVTDSTGIATVTGLTPGNYYFLEVKAPTAHLLDSTPISVTLTEESITEGKVTAVEQSDKKIPDTSDHSNIFFDSVLMMLAMISAAGCFILKRRHSN